MAAGSTYTPIATTTLGSAAASYTFSSIPSTYTDLVLIMDVLGAGTADLDVTVNSDTGANYSRTYLSGNGSTASSFRSSSQNQMRFTGTAYLTSSARWISTANFQNYSNATTYKTVLSRDARADQGTDANVYLWRSTSAITSITLTGNGANLAAGSTFTLYGIAAA